MQPITPETLTAFCRAYLIAALWSSTDNTRPDGGDPLDANYSISDLAPEALAQAVAECEAFENANAETLVNAIATGLVVCGPDFNEWERAGHDFWLTRNSHGCGFWDGDWPEPYATKLTEAAEAAGNRDLYVGDDGKLHFSPG